MNPQLFIITGSNGAGKSTYNQALLPVQYKRIDIFDGDIFYTQQSTAFYKLTRSSKEARKLAEEALEKEFLRLVESSISEKKSFAYEGHFTGEGAWATPKRFKAEGFDIHLIFCGLTTLSGSVQRVKNRVKKGGFHVMPLAIENNYWGNMNMLDKNFMMFNSVRIIDTSTVVTPIAHIISGKTTDTLPEIEIPEWVKEGMPNIFKVIAEQY